MNNNGIFDVLTTRFMDLECIVLNIIHQPCNTLFPHYRYRKENCLLIYSSKWITVFVSGKPFSPHGMLKKACHEGVSGVGIHSLAKHLLDN